MLVVALKPLHDAVGVKRVVCSTYQSVSGAGKDAILQYLRGVGVDPSPGLVKDLQEKMAAAVNAESERMTGGTPIPVQTTR